MFHFKEDGVIPTSKKISLILDFLTKCMKTRQRPLSKFSRMTGQLLIEFSHHICYIQKYRRNIGRDVDFSLLADHQNWNFCAFLLKSLKPEASEIFNLEVIIKITINTITHPVNY